MTDNLEQNNKNQILIVEDDKFLRELLFRKLKDNNFNVSVAVDGLEALKKIKDGGYKVVLLDLVLPGEDGFEVLKKIKEDPETNKISVIILSNLGQQEEVERGLKLGAEDYLIKAHFTPGEIVDKVEKILNKE